MHHHDRDIHRTGFTGSPITRPWPRKRKPLFTFTRVAWAMIAVLAAGMAWRAFA